MIAYQPGRVTCWPNQVTGLPLPCASTITLVDIEFAVMKTATMDRPMATSYEIICALDRRPPSNGYVEPDAHPPSTTPYTPIDEQASTTSTDTGVSVSCNGVMCPKIDTCGPSGITENAVNAVTVEITGAKKKTTLSAIFGMMSSLNASFSPSARLCSQPFGPTLFGPGRWAARGRGGGPGPEAPPPAGGAGAGGGTPPPVRPAGYPGWVAGRPVRRGSPPGRRSPDSPRTPPRARPAHGRRSWRGYGGPARRGAPRPPPSRKRPTSLPPQRPGVPPPPRARPRGC